MIASSFEGLLDREVCFSSTDSFYSNPFLLLHLYYFFSGDFSSFAGDGSSDDEGNDDGPGKKAKVLHHNAAT